jgi:hypothetical protein
MRPADRSAPTRPVTIRFDVELWTWVMAEAAREDRSASNFVQHVVRTERSRRERRRRAKRWT